MDTDIFLSLRKFLAPEIVYGTGALELAARHTVNLGASKVLVVTDAGVQSAGWALKVHDCLEAAGVPYVNYSDTTPNPKDHEVMAGVQVYQNEGCDLIIAVGGGSPMDCAKGIGVVSGNGGHILDYEGVDEVPNPGPPLIFIPTTAGTSADVSQFAIITDTRRHLKIAIVSKMVIPDIALVDPRTTVTMSPELTAETGMDALCHAFEAFVSTASSPLTDMAALAAVERVQNHLIGAYRNPDDMMCRDHMMMASLMAGLAFSNASLGLVHSMAHSLGGALNLPHGELNAILLEQVVMYNYSTAGEKYDRLAVAMGLDIDAIDPPQRASALADHVAALRIRLGITQRLVDMGVSLSDVPQLAGFAHKDPCLATNPRTASPEDIEKIYKAIYV